MRGTKDWVSIFKKWVTSAFPRAQITVDNAAVAGNPSSFANGCFDRLVGSDFDLLVIEYAANDGKEDSWLGSRKAKVYEKLVRRALGKPHRPAVVMLQAMPDGVTKDPYPEGFYKTVEDVYGALAQYYDVPWLSLRTAVYADIMWKRVPGFDFKSFLSFDQVHPNDLGHRYLSDMVVWLLQQTALGLLMSPYSAVDAGFVMRGLPPPMYPGNYEEQGGLCNYDEGLRDVVVEADSPGWSLLDEGHDGRKKLGYVSSTVGSTLKIKVNTSAVVPPGGDKDVVGVTVTYLRSYEHMGQAVMRCASGCVCTQAVANGHHREHNSQSYQITLQATPHPECIVTVTVLPETSSGEHKFKVTAVMLFDYKLSPLVQDLPGGMDDLLRSMALTSPTR